MQILSQHHVAGIVPYMDAWEIPSCAVMELIDGPNLEEVILGAMVNDWPGRLRIARDLASIILRAHSVPERVLHRDIRPANIMLKNFFVTPDSWELVVLDFDLSWHRDATEGSLDLSRSMNSYLAPEQTQTTRKKYTRNALVDSYGFGMTMYFVVSREHPAFGQHRYANWKQLLDSKVVRMPCVEWKSLPRRFARLIENTTKDEQDQRWDMTRISGELQRLQEAHKGPHLVTSAELFAEELISHCTSVVAEYEWDPDSLAASVEFRSGFTVKVVGDETKRLVQVRVEWLHTGDQSFENVRKFIGKASDQCQAELKKGAWRIKEKQVTSSSCRIDAEITLTELRKGDGLATASKGLTNGLECLRLVR
jgi:serine/threonine protein kinase